MKTKAASQSAFFNPRALLGFGFGAIGLLLAVLGFMSFPSSTALARPGTCVPVSFKEVPGEDYNELYVQMISGDNCTIYYSVSATTWPPDPTHSSAIYNPTNDPNYEGLGVPYPGRRYYKAFAHKASAYPTEDSIITSYLAINENP